MLTPEEYFEKLTKLLDGPDNEQLRDMANAQFHKNKTALEHVETALVSIRACYAVVPTDQDIIGVRNILGGVRERLLAEIETPEAFVEIVRLQFRRQGPGFP